MASSSQSWVSSRAIPIRRQTNALAVSGGEVDEALQSLLADVNSGQVGVPKHPRTAHDVSPAHLDIRPAPKLPVASANLPALPGTTEVMTSRGALRSERSTSARRASDAVRAGTGAELSPLLRSIR